MIQMAILGRKTNSIKKKKLPLNGQHYTIYRKIYWMFLQCNNAEDLNLVNVLIKPQ